MLCDDVAMRNVLPMTAGGGFFDSAFVARTVEKSSVCGYCNAEA